MKYRTNGTFSHEQEDKIGVLITNLGTPEAPDKGALKRYLKEFLSDPRVVEVPKFIWWMILNLVTCRKHAAKVWRQSGGRFCHALWLAFD